MSLPRRETGEREREREGGRLTKVKSVILLLKWRDPTLTHSVQKRERLSVIQFVCVREKERSKRGGLSVI